MEAANDTRQGDCTKDNVPSVGGRCRSHRRDQRLCLRLRPLNTVIVQRVIEAWNSVKVITITTITNLSREDKISRRS